MKLSTQTFVLVFLTAVLAHGQSHYLSEETLREHQINEAIRRVDVPICHIHEGSGATERSYRLFLDSVYMRSLSDLARKTLKEMAQTTDSSERALLESQFQKYHREIEALITTYEQNRKVHCP